MNDLELHYYLDDGKHSMNAIVKNRAEYELLKLITEISSLLDIELLIEIGPIEEGGIKEIIKFFEKKKNRAYLITLLFLSPIIANVLTNVISDRLNSDEELIALTKEEKRLNIQKLKQDLEQSKDRDTTIIVNKITNIISNDFKVKVFKSRFYSQILKESDIYKLSIKEINNQQILPSIEYSIARSDFKEQILEDENTPLIIIEDANIEVVAPVLKPSEMRWRGIYQGKSITFELKDADFKNAVLNKQFSFSNGTSIRCKLTYKKGLSENGDICLKDINVYDVLEIFDATLTLQTEKYKKKQASANQFKLPF